MSGPKKGSVSLHLIALGFCLPYALPPSPRPKHSPGSAARDCGLAQKPNLISHNPYFFGLTVPELAYFYLECTAQLELQAAPISPFPLSR